MPPHRPRLYHVLQLAAQRMRKHADEIGIDTAGVSAAQGGAMFVIEANPGISQRDLARALGQQESAVTTMISRLMAADLVSRSPRDNDPRIWALELTGNGKSALAKLRIELDRINRRIDSVLTPEERATLAEALRRVAQIEW